jgi:hypothetical protein
VPQASLVGRSEPRSEPGGLQGKLAVRKEGADAWGSFLKLTFLRGNNSRAGWRSSDENGSVLEEPSSILSSV